MEFHTFTAGPNTHIIKYDGKLPDNVNINDLFTDPIKFHLVEHTHLRNGVIGGYINRMIGYVFKLAYTLAGHKLVKISISTHFNNKKYYNNYQLPKKYDNIIGIIYNNEIITFSDHENILMPVLINDNVNLVKIDRSQMTLTEYETMFNVIVNI